MAVSAKCTETHGFPKPYPPNPNRSTLNPSHISPQVFKKMVTLLDLCVSSLRRGHANLLCIVPILTDDPRRESNNLYLTGNQYLRPDTRKDWHLEKHATTLATINTHPTTECCRRLYLQKKGLRFRNSPICTLSQNGYGNQ